MQKNVKVIARFAIIFALVAVAYSIDTLISIGLPMRVAWVVLIVSLTIMQQFGFGTAVYTGFCFGFISFLFSFMFPKVTSPAFMNPLVSILPRMLVGVTCYWTLRLFKFITRNRQNTFVRQLLPSSVSGAVGVLTNTVTVLSMIALMSGGDIIMTIIGVIISINFIPELAIGLLLVPTLSVMLSKRLKKMNI